MSARVVITREAAADIEGIAAWLSQTTNQKAKLDFLTAIASASQLLTEYPQLGRGSTKLAGLREFIIDRKYRLYYQYDISAEVLAILGVVDMRRDPDSIRL